MVDENPYAPPVEPSEAYQPPAAQAGGLSISAHGWQTVAEMSKWMRIVSGVMIAGAVIFALGGLVVFAVVGRVTSELGASGGLAGGAAIIGTAVMIAYAVIMFLQAIWLRRAATHFYEGVMADHESPLAHGFRNLRLYLILYGVIGILGLLGQVVQLAMGGR